MNEEVKKHALRILDKKDVSRKMLIDKLTEKGASDGDAQEVADWLCDIGAVSDERYAELIVRHYSAKGYGVRRIQEEFYRRGISRDLWENALAELPETEDTVYTLLSQKLKRTEVTADDIRRAEASLLRRGYSWSEIRSALERYQSETEDCE